MKQKRTIEEINSKINAGEAVVVSADEINSLNFNSPADVFDAVDIVTTGTFSPMCSSGIFLNFGQPHEHIKIKESTLNGVETMSGLAAVDAYLGASTASETNNSYGGAHVIEELIKGKQVALKALGGVTDCYGSEKDERTISLDTINEAYMFNPRNCYQNYAAATNSSDKKLQTYMGTLLPHGYNINYCTSGELSPLLNDPELRTIGTGTKILLCGGTGYIAGKGTQFNTQTEKNHKGIPLTGAATLALKGDLRNMSPGFVKAVYMPGYGVTLFVAVSIPVPILDKDIAARAMIANSDIDMSVLDFGVSGHPQTAQYTYAELASGTVNTPEGKRRTVPLSSITVARRSAALLKELIDTGMFKLTQPVEYYSDESIPPKTNSAQSLQCALCGSCVSLCPQHALIMDHGQIYHDPLLCNDCGICKEICPCGLLKGYHHDCL